MKNRNTNNVVVSVSIGIFMLIGIGLASEDRTYAQNATNATTPVRETHEETEGEKTFYVFTSEVQNVDEDKLGVAGDSFSKNVLLANQGDKVNINFYNVDDVQTEKHSFTIDDPYKVDIDLAFDEKGNSTFTADQAGVFTFYCAYHLPVMKGQLVVLP
jgi:plastocyanin